MERRRKQVQSADGAPESPLTPPSPPGTGERGRTGPVDGERGTTTQLEYLVSQFVDGTLDDEGRAELERVMARNPSAMRLVESHRTIDAWVKRSSYEVPEFDWARLTAETAADRRRVDAARRRWAWLSRVGGVAAAAAAVIAVGVGILEQQASPRSPQVVVEWGDGDGFGEQGNVEVMYENARAAEGGGPVERRSNEPMRVIAVAAVGRQVEWPTGAGWPGEQSEW